MMTIRTDTVKKEEKNKVILLISFVIKLLWVNNVT